MPTESLALTPREVAELLHQSEAALAQDRYRGLGPKFVKHGRRVLYLRQDIVDYLEANRVQRTDDPRGAGVA
jgi:hypothetical protein